MSDITSINAAIRQQQTSADRLANLKLVEIPKSLENSSQIQILRGRVIRIDNDGMIIIQTDKGEIKAKIEQLISLQQGDNIEIKINKGNPPQSANIKLAPTVVIEQNIAPIMAEIAIPLSLSTQELIDQKSVGVELLSPQIAQKLTSPYIEIINSKMNLVMVSSEQKIPSPPPILTENLNVLPVSQKSENINASFKMDIPITEIPLRFMLTQMILSRTGKPINIDLLNPENPTLSVFTEIKIKEIAHSYDPKIISERAGEILFELTGFTSDKNFPVLKIAIAQNDSEQYYALKIPVEGLELGSIIKADIITSINITIPAPLTIIGQNIYPAPEIWSVMQEITQALAQANPVVAQAFNNAMPNPVSPAQLGGAALFFLAAMRSGDVQSWLGERVVDILKRSGKSDLITRLGAEFSALSRMNGDVAQEWRSLSLPLAWQNEIHKIAIHYRKEGESDQGNDSNGSKTRFVMDLNLSNMGKIQLDGLFIGNPEGVGRLDLILRTQQSFSQAMKMEMREKYKNTLDDISFSGELAFQDNPDQWVNIMPDAKSKFLEDV